MIAVYFMHGEHWNDRIVEAVERVTAPSSAPQPLATHCGLYWDVADQAIEAAFPRVRLIPAVDIPPDARVYPLAIPLQEQFSFWWGDARPRLGDWYNLPGLLASGWYTITGRPERFFDSRLAAVHCSQLVVEVVRRFQDDFYGDVPASNISPLDLELKLAEHTTAFSFGDRHHELRR